MAHVLCITSGLTGILNASFELVRRLEAAGHRVTSLSPSPVREAVEAQGLAFEALPSFVKEPVPPPPSQGSRLRRVVARYASHRARVAAGADALRIDEATRTLTALGADLALIDVEAHEAVLAAHAAGLPIVLLSPWFSLWPGTGQPPLSSLTVPGEGSHGRPEAVQAEWDRLGAEQRTKRLRLRLRGHADRSDALLHGARHVGFPVREWVRARFPPPFVYRTLPVLSMTLEEMEFPQRGRPGLHYIGPMVSAERRDARAAPEADAAIGRAQTAGARLVYGTVGSMNAGDGAFLQRLVAVFARRPDWHLVLGLGGKTGADGLGPLPPNVTALPWAPQLRLLAAADAAIHHAGINTIHECLHFGVPMLVTSGGRHDQNGCAARVAYHRLGVLGDAGADDEAALERKLEQVLTDPALREAVVRFQGFATHHREANTVAELVAAYLPG